MKHLIRGNDYGQALVEFALVMMLLALLILGTFDLGYAVFTDNLISNAAREGARAGAIIGNDDNAIRARVRATAAGLNLPDSQIQITPSTREFRQPITVTVDYHYNPLTPIVGSLSPGGINLSSTSVMLVEGVYDPSP